MDKGINAFRVVTEYKESSEFGREPIKIGSRHVNITKVESVGEAPYVELEGKVLHEVRMVSGDYFYVTEKHSNRLKYLYILEG